MFPSFWPKKWRFQGWRPGSNQSCLQVSCVSQISFPPPRTSETARERGRFHWIFVGDLSECKTRIQFPHLFFHWILYVFLSGKRMGKQKKTTISAELWARYQPNQHATSGKHLKSMVAYGCPTGLPFRRICSRCHSPLHYPRRFSQRHAFFCKLIVSIDRFVSWKWTKF